MLSLSSQAQIGKELIALGLSHRMNQSDSATQLFFNGQFISLERLESDPQLLFDRLRYRVCSAPEAVASAPALCRDDYNLLTESIVGHLHCVDRSAFGRKNRAIVLLFLLDAFRSMVVSSSP